MSKECNPNQRLIVYGSLVPGEANHSHVSQIAGKWWQGWVEGTLHQEGWGASQGFPGLHWQPGAGRIPVHVLDSEALPGNWERLDEFEGPGYHRITVPVFKADATSVLGSIYTLRGSETS